MRSDGAAERHRQGVEELVGLLYADTPLQKIRERACALARDALNAECVLLTLDAEREPPVTNAAYTDGASQSTAADGLAARAKVQGDRIFERDGSAGVAVPVRHGDIIYGALAATDSRRREFTNFDADMADVYAGYVAIAQSNDAKIGTLTRHLQAQRRATWGLIAAAVLITVGLIVYGWFTARLGAGRTAEAARRGADLSSDHFQRFTATATQLASTTAAIAPQYVGRRAPTEDLLKTLLQSTPSDVVYGIGLWYKPYAFSRTMRLFGPYVHRIAPDRVALTYQWSAQSYNYPTHRWYRAGESAGSNTVVTPPYFDVDHVYISSVHAIHVRRQFAGVSRVDMTSQSIDLFLQHMSSPEHITYLSTLDRHVVAFPNSDDLIRYARGRHRVKRILDVTDADAAAYIAGRYSADRVTVRRSLSPMPLLLVDSWDPAGLGGSRVPQDFLIAIALLTWGLAVAAILVLRHARSNTLHALDVGRERSRLQLEIDTRVKTEDALRRAADSDRLTGLADRAALLGALERSIEQHAGEGSASTGVLLVDLNGLEGVNQTFGHLAGDEVLVQAASLLRRCCSENDVPARLGSDEFAVLVRGAARVRAGSISECMQRGLAAGIRAGVETVFIDASAGFAEVTAEHQSAQDVIRDADYALTHAKRRGRAMTDFTPDLHAAANRERELQAALRGALARGELRVLYQPIYRLSDREIVAVEALARWMRDDQIVLPGEFIPVAERSGLVVDIDRYVARTATRRLRGLPHFAGLRLSLNVSALHFKSPDAFDALRHMLSGGKANAVDIELTETALMTLSGDAAGVIGRLRESGIGMHLDDFGTGYSSLAYLQHLHIDALKIDRTFVSAMLEDDRAMQIVDAIVQLARRLHIEIIVEGIESAAQERALRDLGATMGQGNYFSEPLTADALEHLLAAAAAR